jgi:hypothetical protein
MVLFPVVNECARLVAEGWVLRESDIDVASVMGYGFPAHTGGVYFWAKSLPGGLQYVHDRLAYFARTVGANNAKMHSFYKPSDALAARAQKPM